MRGIHSAFVPACHADESPASFCSRLARTTGRAARDFCLDVGLRFQDLVDGSPVELEAMARLSGLPEDRFPGLPIVGSGHAFRIAGEVLTRETLSRKILRVCPSCTEEDLETGPDLYGARPYGRTIWLVASIRTCPRHWRPLVTVAEDDRPQLLHDFAALLAPALPSVLTAKVETRVPSDLEAYLLRRIEGRATTGWFDAFPLHAVCRIAETIGAMELHGRRFRTARLTEDDWVEAGATGFGIATRGEGSIRAFLDRLQERFVATRTTWGPRATFGRLYEWLAHESDDPTYDPLRTLVRTHVLETMPVGPGDELFGAPVEVRRLHSIRSASVEADVHPKRLRKLARVAGLADASSNHLSDDRILVEAGRMNTLLSGIVESMSLKEAGRYLGVPRPIDLQLLRSGIVEPWIAGARDSLGEHAFRRSDLDTFLGRVLVERGEARGRILHGVGRAARRANCAVMEIVRLILDGRLPTVVLDPADAGFASVRVDVDEIRPLVRIREHGGFSLREVERRLSTTGGNVKALVERGHLASRRAVNPVNRCAQTVVDHDVLTAFESRYVSLMVLARETGIHHLKWKKRLTAEGILPAIPDVPVAYYERNRLNL